MSLRFAFNSLYWIHYNGNPNFLIPVRTKLSILCIGFVELSINAPRQAYPPLLSILCIGFFLNNRFTDRRVGCSCFQFFVLDSCSASGTRRVLGRIFFQFFVLDSETKGYFPLSRPPRCLSILCIGFSLGVRRVRNNWNGSFQFFVLDSQLVVVNYV